MLWRLSVNAGFRPVVRKPFGLVETHRLANKAPFLAAALGVLT